MLHHGLLAKFNATQICLLFSPQEGRTALALASFEGQGDTVRILVQRGANTDVQDEVHCIYIMEKLSSIANKLRLLTNSQL